jgi:hypothetical protein
MLVALKQINLDELTAFIALSSSGSVLSGNLQPYVRASGWLGSHVVYVTGNQTITGLKTFLDAPAVPYTGGTGRAPSTLFVLDCVSTLSGILNTSLTGASGVLSARTTPNVVTTTGNETIGGQKIFTGSPYVPTPIHQSGAVNWLLVSGMSGYLLANAGGAGGVNPTGIFVPITGDMTISGTKVFVLSPWVPNPTEPSGAVNRFQFTGYSGFAALNFVNLTTAQTIGGAKIFSDVTNFSSQVKLNAGAPVVGVDAVNLDFLSGVSGVLIAGGLGGTTNYYYITGTGVVTAMSTGNVNNTFNITSGNVTVLNSGTVTNNLNLTNSNYNNIVSISGITGNFVNMSFYFDEYGLMTGNNLVESFVGRDFIFTGYAIGAINSGTPSVGPFFTGSLYQRTTTNTKVPFAVIGIPNGSHFRAVGGFSQVISGLNRVGFDLSGVPTGMTGVSIGIFGFGY